MASHRHIVGSREERAAQGALELVVPDLARALSFYASLGFETLRRTDGFAVMTFGDVHLLFAEDPAATTAPRWANLRIVVADVDRIWALLRHLPIACPIGDREYGLRDFTVRDPFGFELRFAQLIE